MYRLLHLLLFLCPAVTFSQQSILCEITATKKAAGQYELMTKAIVKPGWKVYAQSDTSHGIEAVQLSWDNEQIIAATATSNNAVTIRDALFDNIYLKVYTDSFTLKQVVQISGAVPASLPVIIKGFASGEDSFEPFEVKQDVALEGGATTQSRIKLSTIDINNPVAGCGAQQQEHKSFFSIFLLGFAGGLIALLTPCVFPMIPVTVSFFTNRAATKRQGIANAVWYGACIAGIYLLVSAPFHFLGGINPEIFNTISTNVWVNLGFFAVFIFFALSFFGLFEITLPSGMANAAVNKGGIVFMALTLTIVSFSCTGPILGSLLVGSLSAQGGAVQLTAGMGGFGLALALPFALFAMFPEWLKKLPKSGGWMDTVKKVLAFVELALACKFLSNADLVANWGILKREVFVGIWILISLALALYLLGIFDKKKVPELRNADIASPVRTFKMRSLIGIIVLLFALYLIPALLKNPPFNLELLSGFPPPKSYSIYNSHSHTKNGSVEPLVINDYEKALQLARQTNKPLLIDFTGWACVNCRKMEEQVWTKPEIQALISENFILVSLYVDDRKKLPADKRFTYTDPAGNKKTIITTGDQWATFQSENFKQVTQPLYVIISPQEELMNHPVGYTPDEKKYAGWLQCGLNAFDKNIKKGNVYKKGYDVKCCQSRKNNTKDWLQCDQYDVLYLVGI